MEVKGPSMQPICSFVAFKLVPSFPAMVPPGNSTNTINHLLAQYNDLAAQLLIACVGVSQGCHEVSAVGDMHGRNKRQSGGNAVDQLVLAAARSSNAYSHFSASAAVPVGHSHPASWPLQCAEATEQKLKSRGPKWLPTLLAFCRDVLHNDVAVRAPKGHVAALKNVRASAALFSTALRGLEASMAVVWSFSSAVIPCNRQCCS
jgi:hypothetical protein